MSVPGEAWSGNYFNYFTEVEEHFRKARGTGLFLLSPLDWALIESWKNSGVPLQAVLRGIDLAFEKWRSRKQMNRLVNSVAYCTQAVLAEAQLLSGEVVTPRAPAAAPFSKEELLLFLERNARKLRQLPDSRFAEVAQSLEQILLNLDAQYDALEELEQHLTVLEEKMAAVARTSLSEETLLSARKDLHQQLKPYRGKMTADQLAMLEKQYLDRRLFEAADLPRLSLFYL